ncbi:MAG: bifunctional 5,10-methylenetetrahydrofolate dehydrogenase/5,10-methenyltetrahydrofolate cyclohydrolase [Syntrophomonas sp.]|jgi:methylenetetrahydrofolate dehydrogenase (NADP+)/methenyltetrahydrofolate cyclohydrolase|nr:bifunctional 5,10-methylenetetrahydrofolate dehydrogenase/5,10-methenyltetrahydrofolate cyclohydrolase [Syntrophomonas sp.]
MKVISGKTIADEIKGSLKQANSAAGVAPCLAIIDIGTNKENALYTGLKRNAVAAIGGTTRSINLAEDTSRERVLATIQELNQDEDVDGILLQLPVPEGLEPYREEFLAAIAPGKDVDGFNSCNRGLLIGGEPYFVSCAALACMDISRRFRGPLSGKRVLLVGDSFDVIQPLAIMFIKEGCHVVVTPRYHPTDMEDMDIAIIEPGAPFIVKRQGIKEGALLIDAGFHWHEERTCGNIDPEEFAGVEGYILPVPGGMGPLLIAHLMDNLTRAAGKE